MRGVYDDGACLNEEESPYSYACVEIDPGCIEATGWMAEAIFGPGRTYGFKNGVPPAIEEIAAKLIAYRTGLTDPFRYLGSD